MGVIILDAAILAIIAFKRVGYEMKVPNSIHAQIIISEASKLNPGIWVEHNKVAAKCARRIAEKCSGLDEEVAYSLGLLHDIGRRFGELDLQHTIQGYRYMNNEGYLDSARICLTHSFPYKDIRSYNGANDCSDSDSTYIKKYLSDIVYDDYDRLIQLCDAISYPTGPCYLEKRFVDVVLKKGFNDLTIVKWKELIKIKEEFDLKANCNIYALFD